MASKIMDQGFWKSLVYYYVSQLYYCLYCLRFRSITWFSAANPSIHLGGMLDEEKSAIYPLLPSEVVPHTTVFTDPKSLQDLHFPVFVKPDIGLKGYKVRKCYSIEEVEEVVRSMPQMQWLAQEYLDFKREYSILVYFDGQSYGVSSFVEKKYPTITGDGQQTIKSLIDHHPHAYLDHQLISLPNNKRWDTVLTKGEVVQLHEVGNYSRGATFYNQLAHLDDKIKNQMIVLLQQCQGINFGRFDLKANSLTDLGSGDYKIIEVNGAKAEPIEIYDKSVSWLQTFGIIHRHWVLLARVSRHHIQQGHVLPTTSQGLTGLAAIRRRMKIYNP